MNPEEENNWDTMFTLVTVEFAAKTVIFIANIRDTADLLENVL